MGRKKDDTKIVLTKKNIENTKIEYNSNPTQPNPTQPLCINRINRRYLHRPNLWSQIYQLQYHFQLILKILLRPFPGDHQNLTMISANHLQIRVSPLVLEKPCLSPFPILLFAYG